jgi:FkbM family methyltransferase
MMNLKITKALVLKLISLGLRVPEAPINRYFELIHLKKLLAMLDINCVLDVGANRGQFAYELRAIGYAGQIISFEPIEHEFAKLCQLFAYDSKWRGYQIALGRENTSTTINVSENSAMSSLLERVESGNAAIRRQVVEVKRLDGIFASVTGGISRPKVFLKMDTQGYDLEVFQGAEKCLDHIHGIQSEVAVQPLYKGMPLYNESFSLYTKAGYELYNVSVVNRISSGGLLELNAFLIKPGMH